MSVSAAKSRLTWVPEDIDKGRVEDAESKLDEAERFLNGQPEDEAAPLRARIAEFRATIGAMIRPEDALKVRAAYYKLKQAQNWIEGNYPRADILEAFDRAVAELNGVPEQHAAAQLADILAARAVFEGGAPAPSAEPEAVTAPVAVGPEPSDEERGILSRVRGLVRGEESNVERRATDGSEAEVDAARQLLDGVRPEFREDLPERLAKILVDAAAVVAAENIRRISSELDGNFRAAESDQAWETERTARYIEKVAERLAEEDAVRILPADTYEQYQVRLANARTALARLIKGNGLERALPYLVQLEEQVATDPFEGLTNDEVLRASGDLKNLRWKVVHELDGVPVDDPEVISIQARLAATDAKIEAADVAWARAQAAAYVTGFWNMITPDFEGWSDEVVAARQPLDPPQLPLTSLAVSGIGRLFSDTRMIEIRREYSGDPAIEPTYQTAEQVARLAWAKLDAAFNEAMDEAERVPMVMGENDRDVSTVDRLAGEARRVFEGTEYLAANLARAERLHTRWQEEIAAVRKARQELQDRLSIEATAAWPAIVAATGAGTEFDPTDTGAVGKVVHLAGVRNRAGWDFNGCDFAMRYDGSPVGGGYEAHVQEALEHAWYTLKVQTDDHIDWDVVGVVEGPGKIGLRTQRVLRDASTNRELGKIEEWPPVECIWLRVIALHAGPVAVGPKD